MADELIKAKRTGVSCQWCKERFTPVSKRGIVPKYCSNAHKQAAYRANKSVDSWETVPRPDPIKRACPACGSKNILIARITRSVCKDCRHRWHIFGADRSQGVTTNDNKKEPARTGS